MIRQFYAVEPIEDGWFAIIYLATGSRVQCYRRKSDAMRRFNRYYRIEPRCVEPTQDEIDAYIACLAALDAAKGIE